MLDSAITTFLEALRASDIKWLKRATPPPSALTLRRAWPKGHDHLLAEYRRGDGAILAAQWFADAAKGEQLLHRLQERFPLAHLGHAPMQGGILTLQGSGTDDTMPLLAEWIARPNTTLLVHRSTRRAVLRTVLQGQTAYVKVVPAKHYSALIATTHKSHSFAHASFLVPHVLQAGSEQESGYVACSPLPGASVHELLSAQHAARAAACAGGALRALHAQAPPADVSTFGANDSANELTRWVDLTSSYAPFIATRVRDHAQQARETLLRLPHSPYTLIHRDFHDKQVFLSEDGRPGLLDFDTLSTGEPALDVGNFLAHLNLRCAQQHMTLQAAQAAHAAFLTAYGAHHAEQHRIAAYRTISLLRLCCVYAFRPGGQAIADTLLRDAAT